MNKKVSKAVPIKRNPKDKRQYEKNVPFKDSIGKCKLCRHNLSSHNDVECVVPSCKCKTGIPYE